MYHHAIRLRQCPQSSFVAQLRHTAQTTRPFYGARCKPARHKADSSAVLSISLLSVRRGCDRSHCATDGDYNGTGRPDDRCLLPQRCRILLSNRRWSPAGSLRGNPLIMPTIQRSLGTTQSSPKTARAGGFLSEEGGCAKVAVATRCESRTSLPR